MYRVRACGMLLVGLAAADRMTRVTGVSSCRPSIEADLKAQAEKEKEAVREMEALLAVDLEGLKKIHAGKVCEPPSFFK